MSTVATMPVSMALVRQSENVLRSGVFLLAILFTIGGCGGGGSSDRERTPDPETWTVSATAGLGGSIDPASQTVDHGAITTFTVTPETGFSIDTVSGCGGSLDGNTYTTGAITEACTVEASFLAHSYEVSATAGFGGGIGPATQTVDHGATATFMVRPDHGFAVDQIVGCDGTLEGPTYTTGVITAACVVSARFSFQTLQATAGNGQVLLRWAVSGADRYTLYHANEGGIQPENFGIWVSQHNGVMVENVTSPHTVAGLNNGTEYFFVVTATAGGQESATSNEMSAVPQEFNDTGITWSGDAVEFNAVFCNPAHPAGQDCHHGRDAVAAAGMLNKVGGGSAGFDFTKIANNGSDLSPAAVLGSGPTDWACTRDNVTGLIWEVKVDDPAHLRFQGHTYTWYDPNSPDGNPGMQNGGSCLGSICDTTNFAQAVNAQGLCGSSDWRMPTWRELQGIVDYGRSSPAIDTGYFPNTPSTRFWSGSPRAELSDRAWEVLFWAGYVGGSGYSRSHPQSVRLVRGGQ